MLITACLVAALNAPPPRVPFTVQITGLFMPERVQDLKDLFAVKLPNHTLVAVDFDKVTALIDPAKTDRAKLEQVLKKGGVELPPTK